MKLIDYLSKRQEKVHWFAKRANIRLETAYDLARGKPLNLTLETIKKIVNATGGAVQYEDLI